MRGWERGHNPFKISSRARYAVRESADADWSVSGMRRYSAGGRESDKTECALRLKGLPCGALEGSRCTRLSESQLTKLSESRGTILEPRGPVRSVVPVHHQY